MTIIAVTRAKTDADILPFTVKRMLAQVDHVIVGVGDEACRQALDGMPVEVIEDNDPTFKQAERMTALAHIAREQGADWVVPFDADEVWCSRLHSTLRKTLAQIPDEVLIAEAKLFDHKVTALDPDNLDPVARMGWRMAGCAPLRKVAVRALEDLQLHGGQHSAGFTDHRFAPAVTDAIEIRHYPYRSAQQMVDKIRVGGPALAASNLPKDFGAHWRMFHEMLEEQGPEALEAWFDRWAFSADPANHPEPLVFDPCHV